MIHDVGAAAAGFESGGVGRLPGSAGRTGSPIAAFSAWAIALPAAGSNFLISATAPC